MSRPAISYGLCVATKPRLDPTAPPKQCTRPAKYDEWCRQHAESLGGWRLAPPDPEGYRGLAASFWVYYRCGYVACRTVEPHKHGGGQPMRDMTPEERLAADTPVTGPEA